MPPKSLGDVNLKGEVDAAWGSEPSTPSAPESGVKRLAPATPGLKAAAAAFVPAAAAAAMHSARVRMSGCPDQDGGLGHDKPPAPSDSIPAADPGDDKATAAVPSDVARVAMQLPDGGLDVSTRGKLLAALGPATGAGSVRTTTFSVEYARSDKGLKGDKGFQHRSMVVQPEFSSLSHEELRLNDYSLYRQFLNKMVLEEQGARTRAFEAAANIKAKASGMAGVFVLTGASYALPNGADVGEACNGIYRQSGEHNGKPLFKRVDGGDAAVYFQGFWKATSPAASLGGWWFGSNDSKGDAPPPGAWRHDGNPWPVEQDGVNRACPTLDWQ